MKKHHCCKKYCNVKLHVVKWLKLKNGSISKLVELSWEGRLPRGFPPLVPDPTGLEVIKFLWKCLPNKIRRLAHLISDHVKLKPQWPKDPGLFSSDCPLAKNYHFNNLISLFSRLPNVGPLALFWLSGPCWTSRGRGINVFLSTARISLTLFKL